jgi:phosphoribosylformimino-5-aminoimidazole carboxamide ribotide isomerase
MRQIPVLDILHGVVVRGVAGQRHQYKPIVSCLTDSVQPLEVARALRSRFGFDELYVADLDAIMYSRAGYALYSELHADGFQLLVDAGVRDAIEAERVLETGAGRVIVGLETCPAPDVLRTIIDRVITDRVVFSLDLQSGVPLGSATWGSDAVSIAKRAIECGARRLIVLDLASVGVGAGVPTLTLCQQIRAASGTAIEIITGGGVRNADDLKALDQAGIDGVLLASVLHRTDCWLAAP